MISFEDAIGLLDENATMLGEEIIPLEQASGRVLAASLYAPRDAPNCPVAAMDGYAVLDASTKPGERLRLIGQSAAGAGFNGCVGPGEAVRIFTGAPMPEGSDRCIMQEYAEREGDTVIFSDRYGPGWHVRSPGSDFSAGAQLVPAGTRLNARAMVAAAAADAASVRVSVRPRVAIVGTGDELMTPGSAHMRADAIPESVTYGVAAMVADAGGIVVERTLGSDDLPALEELAGTLLSKADVVIVTGGASVGERDFAKPMFASHGLESLFEKVAIKPGKPVWLGRAQGKWILGLPGNPTSAMVTGRLFLVPLLAKLQGQELDQALVWRTMPLAAPLRQTGGRETFVRALLSEDGLEPLDNQESGSQAALMQADWLIRCPPNAKSSHAGERVTALAF
ncbi:molybdopterin molybdotransferase MoeA [Qipengyuania gaetbuli]|uniref:molybdopterin molybdotransferase MoeA n=1 Tax=Qipengyuania gaetbuli TaxID=266952 RepID=UPI001CFDD6AC|nr:molybdopterin molybdotransferase MoeA [Qipengyuania gaetbuli]